MLDSINNTYQKRSNPNLESGTRGRINKDMSAAELIDQADRLLNEETDQRGANMGTFEKDNLDDSLEEQRNYQRQNSNQRGEEY